MRSRCDTGGASVALALGSLALLISLALYALPAPARADDGFVDRPSPINGGRLFDLGVTDYDADGRQELFSTNHKFLGTLAESDYPAGGSGWTDLMASARFGPTPDFPGFEDMLDRPAIDQPGLYIYAAARSGSDPEKNPVLHIVAHDVTGIPLLPEQAKGRVTVRSPNVRIKRHDGAQVQVRREGNHTVIDFSVAEQGHIAIRVFKADVPPIDFEIDQAPLLARTFVGPRKVGAVVPNFTLRLVDRHGIAWVDSNRDGRLDAFVVRGGLGGAIATFAGRIDDELLIADARGRFANRYQGSGLVKARCRGRVTAAVDYDADGLLDLFSSCKRGTPRLYRALPSGGYEPRWKGLARRAAKGTYYRWVDLRGNRRPELVVLGKEHAVVLRSKGRTHWKRVQRIRTFNRTKLVYSAAVGDYDRDGDPDLFVGSRSGNTLLVNRHGRLHAKRPRKLGLPGRGSGSSWVDFDNDGRLDLHSLPRGLYRQRRDGTFNRTRIARAKNNIVWGLVSWFDLDNDGYRDYATAVRRPGGGPDVDTRVGLNARKANDWLEVDLSGPDGNPQGVGARVRVRAAGRVQTEWVGDADSSRFSQGHYRVYFGLGKAKRVGKLAVLWPDGTRTTLRDVASDRRLVLSRDG